MGIPHFNFVKSYFSIIYPVYLGSVVGVKLFQYGCKVQDEYFSRISINTAVYTAESLNL